MTSTSLKIIACLTMLIDHVGAVFYPDIIILRVIGRIAFPIFSFLIAEGFYHTKSVNNYLTRLIIFAFISEIPYDLAFNDCILFHTDFDLNVFFTLVFALLVIIIYDKTKETHKYIGVIALVTISIIAELINTDYGLFGVLIVFGFYYFRNDIIKQSICYTAITIVMVIGTWQYYQVFHFIIFIQLFSILSFTFIYLYNGKKGMNIKYLFYVFYPGHLLMLGLLDNII